MPESEQLINYNDFLNFIKRRRSVRTYNSSKVKKDDILKIIEAGIQAASPTNSQGWKFKIIDDKNEINDFTLIIERKLDGLINKIEDGLLKESFTLYSRNFTFIKNSPCIILFFSLKPRKIFKSFFKGKLNSYKGEGTFLSSGMVMQNMMLAALTLGISSCPLTGPLTAEKDIINKYPPPQKYELSGLITFGYADAESKNPGRKRPEQFII